MSSVLVPRCARFAIVLLGLAGAASSPVEAQTSRDRGRGVPLDRINRIMDLRASRLTHVDVGSPNGKPFETVVTVDGEALTLELEPHSVRGVGYRVLVQGADGEISEVPAGPERSYRGRVSGIPGSAVAATVTADGLSARILLSDDEQVWIEPASDRFADLAAGTHVVYNGSDISGGEACGTDRNVHFDPDGFAGAVRSAQAVACGTGLCVAELACDADVEFFNSWGSVADVENRINAVINAVNVQYERDVEIQHQITTILVRTAEPDPYNSTNSSTMLNEFRNHWNANHGNITRDVAQLFTGKNLDGSTIGIAWLNAVCGSYGYGVVQANFTSSFGFVTDLSAHELGHNWGADHCSCSSYTMNPSITGANIFQPSATIPDIVAFRDSRTCLDGATTGCTSDTECDNNNVCDGLETCSAGICTAGTALNCNDGDACTADSCDEASGCSNDVITCNDGDPCTDDSCNAASGCQFAPVQCPVGEECVGGNCVPQICNNDGVCNGDEDCDNCPQDCDSGSGSFCGNLICEPSIGEDCLSCSNDCRGKQNGNPNNRYCCGDGGGQNPVGCNDSRCNNGDWACSNSGSDAYCCGDGFCDGPEDGNNCEIDCGPPPVCGDGNCDANEDTCNCAQDCGSAPTTEFNCSDGGDDDCDGAVDCDDADCAADADCQCDGDSTCETGENCDNCPSDCFSGQDASCGNGLCEAGDGEDCLSCPSDCAGRQNGKRSNRYCCGDGAGQNPVDCSDSRCGACTNVPGTSSCCGDGACEGAENNSNCAVDCP